MSLQEKSNNQGETNGYTDANIVSHRTIQSLSDDVRTFISDTPLWDIFQGLEPRFKEKCVFHGGLIRKILKHYFRDDVLSLRRKFLSGNVDLDTVICVENKTQCNIIVKYLEDNGFIPKTSHEKGFSSFEEYYCPYGQETLERERYIFLGNSVLFSLPLENGEIKLDVSILVESEYSKFFRDDADFVINSLYFQLNSNLLRFRGFGSSIQSNERLYSKMFGKILKCIRLDCSPPTRGFSRLSESKQFQRIDKFDAAIETKDSNDPMILLWQIAKQNNISFGIVFQIYCLVRSTINV